MKRGARKGRETRGFTLLEVLVAFTVLALIAVPAVQVVGTNLRSLAIGAQYTRATSIARSVLDEARVVREIDPDGLEIAGLVEGDGVEFEWRLTFEPYADESLGEDARGRPELEVATVTVSWGERSVRLETLLLDIET